jgi:hypothetical protein
MMCRLPSLAALALYLTSAFTPVFGAETGGTGETVRSFYIGNSLTFYTHPPLHSGLAKPTGNTWKADLYYNGGAPVSKHWDMLFPKYPDLAYPQGNDKLTVRAIKGREAIEKGAWDAVTIQPFDSSLTKRRGTLDVGDVASITRMIQWIRQYQPSASIYLYVTWAVPSYADGFTGEKPNFKAFDYERFWLRPYSFPPPADDVDPRSIMRTRDYHRQLIEALNANPDLAKAGPIRMIPAGDVVLELDRRIKAGKFTGPDGKPFMLERRIITGDPKKLDSLDVVTEQIPFDSVNILYRDFQHWTPGLPRYFVAAMFYAVLFGQKPERLDYSGYNERFPSKGADGKLNMDSFYDWKMNDNDQFIKISPETAAALADVIWGVVSKHPHTGIQ